MFCQSPGYLSGVYYQEAVVCMSESLCSSETRLPRIHLLLALSVRKTPKYVFCIVHRVAPIALSL